MKANLIETLHDLPADAKFPNGAAIDTETRGLNVLRDRLCLCQLSDGNGNVWLVKFDGETWDAPNLRKLLEDASIPKLFHYARFDVASLQHYLNTTVNNIYCTKIASKLVRTYTERHGLRSLVEEIVGVSLDKTEQQSDWANPVLTDAQKHYAASDVLYLHKLRTYLDTRLSDLDRTAMAQACFDFLPTRVQLDLNGWEETDIFAHQ